ncbi:hypothetical protein GCM10007420_03580 [Glycocaulis albus]|uniref:Uncharacterized protein n=1 Tax=Glycocaulis albus TaxID=1382801 RepID=A0ABQ1XDQ2_9PROT|nr:hypothetical protein GCM10007420_03580 [Glycocaulis albus]
MLQPLNDRLHKDGVAGGRLRQFHRLAIVCTATGEKTERADDKGGTIDCAY